MSDLHLSTAQRSYVCVRVRHVVSTRFAETLNLTDGRFALTLRST